jgi:hypothetical protein
MGSTFGTAPSSGDGKYPTPTTAAARAVSDTASQDAATTTNEAASDTSTLGAPTSQTQVASGTVPTRSQRQNSALLFLWRCEWDIETLEQEIAADNVELERVADAITKLQLYGRAVAERRQRRAEERQRCVQKRDEMNQVIWGLMVRSRRAAPLASSFP